MLFNLTKCKVLHVGKNNLKHQYSMGGLPLDHVTEEKDLGVTVTESFKSSKQFKIAAAKANRILVIIYKNLSMQGRCCVYEVV